MHLFTIISFALVCSVLALDVVGQSNEGYIVNGESVLEVSEIPFQVAILRRNQLAQLEYICGGSLLANRTVLSAAHCFYGLDRHPDQFRVRYGTLDHRAGPMVEVMRITLHPSFRRNLYDMDLAVLTLSTTFDTSSGAAPVALSVSTPPAGSTIGISGWGKLSAVGPVSIELKKTQLTVMTPKECSQAWTDKMITDSMLCAREVAQSACQVSSPKVETKNNSMSSLGRLGRAGHTSRPAGGRNLVGIDSMPASHTAKRAGASGTTSRLDSA